MTRREASESHSFGGTSGVETRRRGKRAYLSADSEIDIQFLDLEITKFCPKRIFDIIVINETDEKAQNAMKDIIATGRKYEDVSCVTFIHFSEVIKLLDSFDSDVLPGPLGKMVEQVLGETKTYLRVMKPEQMPVIKMAILIKIKLVEVMIRHYRREVDKMEKRKVLIAELDKLTQEDDKPTSKNKKNKPEPVNMEHRDSKRGSKNSKILEDLLGRLDTESDVIFDDDIFNHVWFYAFVGFYNARVLNYLLSSKIPLTAVVKIHKQDDMQFSAPDSVFTKFWSELDEMMFSHNRCDVFENTMLMEFTVPSVQDDLDVFQDLLYVIKSISEIKFQHLNYIRHINVYQMDNDYNHLPLQCMHTYNKIMSNIPLELTDEIVVLSSLLEETCFQLDATNVNDRLSLKDTLSRNSISMLSNVNCPDPRNMYNFETVSERGVDNSEKRIPPNFQCYEGDILTMVLNMYKPAGKLVYDLSLNVLKCIKPFNLLEMDYKADEVIHKHDVDPSTKKPPVSTDSFDHFINLFVFCTFEHSEQIQKPYEKEKFTENLITYDNVAFYNNLRPRLDEKTKRSSNFFDFMYNTNPMDYYWREKYPAFNLIQAILKSQQKFVYMDTRYCPETDRLLVQFCDWVDEFGLNTICYDETLLTPVCLRDFCRYTANEVSNWIKENKPPKYVRKNEEAETCTGARRFKKQDLFEEYRYLLETNYSDTMVDDVKSITGMASTDEVTFDEMIYQLENYPSNTRLRDEYSKGEYSKDFLAYDFGTKYFALRGARTVFSSHDNVKIAVENSKFIDENFKCTVELQYNDNYLILHSADSFRHFYSFHWLLKDGTRIVFEIQKKSKKATLKTMDTSESTELDIETHSDFEEKEKITLNNITVKNINEEDIEKVFKKSPTKENLTPMDIYQGLNEAIEKNLPIYKVNKGYETIKVIKPIGDIPVANILQRVLHNVEKPNTGSQDLYEKTKKYLPLHYPPTNLQVLECATFRITLPNGIYVTCFPSQIKDSLVEVKQEILSPHLKPIRTEEFRLFTREGYILIKKIDGTVTILMSNGNKIDFDKPDSDKEEIKNSQLKPVHCKTVDDYRKRLNKLMKKRGLVNDTYNISRRGSLETKRGYVVNKEIVKILESSKLPYLKSSLLNFDGTKTVLEENKISQKRLFYTVSENDFVKEEIYYERKDGFRCLLKGSAEKTVEYPDGTRITSTATVFPELVDGYVYITLYYKFEHPYYATVSYSEGDLLQIMLNSVVIERTKDNLCVVKMDKGIAVTTVDADTVTFEKKCEKCNASFTSTFDISPFHNNFLDFTKQFVHACDSYQKHFFVDYAGICRINKNYLNGAINSENCNHFENNTYKKLYAVKKTLSGEQFFTENMVKAYKEKFADNDTVSITQKGKRTPVLKFIFKHYDSFRNRYLTKDVLKTEITLTKYQQMTENHLYYSTIRLFVQLMNAEKIQLLLSHLIKQFSEIDIDNKTKQLLQWLADKKEEEANLKREESQLKNLKLMEEEAKKCKCVKDKRTFARKISQWGDELKRIKKLLRERNIPLYFNSDFCQRIKKNQKR